MQAGSLHWGCSAATALRHTTTQVQGKDWNGQLKWGTSNFYGANYFQSVTPQLSVGGEVFYLAEQRRRCAFLQGFRDAGTR